jgi:hypothetical protein
VSSDGGTDGYGVLYEMVPKTKTETILHSFNFSSDGAYSYATPVLFNGNIYGTCYYGGSGGGTVWEYIP